MSTYEELQLIVSVAVLIVAILNYTQNKECALAHSCACGGRLRHLHCTPQCASLAERFFILGKHFPNI